jgi:signal transduction histidine kinase
MSFGIIFLFSIAYLLLLFGVALWAERRSDKSPTNNPYIYALSLAVYCTAWTFYGSVGRAANSGIEFLTIYLGPTLIMPLWWLVMRKIIRICRVQNITNMADFIAARYGKSATLGALVTLFMVLGIVPYISIQIKAITDSYYILWQGGTGNYDLPSGSAWNGIEGASLYFTCLLAVFSLWFGTRTAQTTKQNKGMVTTIAFESVIKLLTFLIVGIYVTYGIFGGLGDIFSQIQAHSNMQKMLLMNGETAYYNWFILILLSGTAIMFLPRQFQVAVVENTDEKHLDKAIWLFPLYLLLINLFVLPIAFGGKLLLGDAVNADNYMLAIAMNKGNHVVAMLAYLGGFSAATGMIIVETIALSLMISNNLIMPTLAKINRLPEIYLGKFALYSRRFSILLLLFLSYLYYYVIADHYSLVSIGLISFAASAQLAPTILGGIFWRFGTQAGAFAGLLSGFGTWAYTLVLPTLISADLFPQAWLVEGVGGFALFKPTALWGVSGIDSLEQAVFWSLFFNLFAYVGVSLLTRQSSKEHNQAELFVDIFKYSEIYESSVVWKGKASIPDIRTLLINFLGQQKTESLLAQYAEKYAIDWNESTQADSRLVTFAEVQLASIIGSTSARIVVASVAEEEYISIDEVVAILKESQQLLVINQELKNKTEELFNVTEELQRINLKLKEKDSQKDEFLYTVTHELRTPLTSIRALSEIIYDYDDVTPTERRHFIGTIIKEAERMTRLITQVLDLEKLESGAEKLQINDVEIMDIIDDAIDIVKQLANEKKVALSVEIAPFMPMFWGDKDKLIQVLVNLLSNAIKFCPPHSGLILLKAFVAEHSLHLVVWDNGMGIPDPYKERIFDKFYQAQTHNKEKPYGSGLGLAISKKIVELHKGKIWAENNDSKGATFFIQLPLD